MKYKYIMSGGLAFSEESDMEKLKKYAKKGWILEDFVFMFYKLRKDNPQNIDYAVDYQSEADEEYFAMFKEAGWSKVLSISDEIHFFSAPEGTKPIYTDRESKLHRDEKEKRKFGKYSIYTFILFVLLFPLPILSRSYGLSLLNRVSTAVFFFFGMIPFIFTFMPYLGYVHRVRKMSINK